MCWFEKNDILFNINRNRIKGKFTQNATDFTCRSEWVKSAAEYCSKQVDETLKMSSTCWGNILHGNEPAVQILESRLCPFLLQIFTVEVTLFSVAGVKSMMNWQQKPVWTHTDLLQNLWWINLPLVELPEQDFSTALVGLHFTKGFSCFKSIPGRPSSFKILSTLAWGEFAC